LEGEEWGGGNVWGRTSRFLNSLLERLITWATLKLLVEKQRKKRNGIRTIFTGATPKLLRDGGIRRKEDWRKGLHVTMTGPNAHDFANAGSAGGIL